MSERLTQKIVLVGWDGADWTVARALMRAGRMPHLHALVESGVSGDLAAPRPLLSPVVWNSLVTGMRPHKHGVLGDVTVGASDTSVRGVAAADRAVPAVWDIVARAGLVVHQVNWPASHPARTADGVTVSDGFLNGRLPDSVAPADAVDVLEQLRIDPENVDLSELFGPAFTDDAQDPDDVRPRIARAVVSQSATVHAAATWAMEDQAWDLTAVLYRGIEQISQIFMPYHPPQQAHVAGADFANFSGVVARIYEFHDLMLGRLVDLAGPAATIVLVSDHGFRSGKDRNATVSRSADESATAWHLPHGMLVASGAGVKKDDVIEGARVVDVAPTVLALFGLPVSRDMDGQPLASLFDRPVAPDRVDTWDEAMPVVSAPAPASTEATADDDVSYLRELGYVESAAPRTPTEDEFRAEFVRNDNRYALARALLDAGQPGPAAELLERLMGFDPKHPGYIKELLDCYYALGRWGDARKLAETVWELGVQDAGVLMALAHIDNNQRRFASALTRLQQAEQALLAGDIPEQAAMLLPEVYLTLGNTSNSMGRYEEAERAYAKAVELNDKLDAGWTGRAVAALARGRASEAMKYSRKAIALKTDSPAAHFNLGMALGALKHYPEAVQSLRRSLALQPDVPVVYRRLIEFCQADPAADPALVKKYQAELDALNKTRQLNRQGRASG